MRRMHKTFSLSSMLLLSAIATGCVEADQSLEAPETESLDTTEQLIVDPATRIYNIVEAVLPAGNYDGIAGNECVALLNPEYRLRKIILVEAASGGGACSLTSYTAGNAISFTWGNTSAYSNSGGAAAVRLALGDDDGAVHRLIAAPTSEAAALANLQAFLAMTDLQQAAQLATFPATRVHSLYDFEGSDEVKAEAAYQAVRVTQPCENPGEPRLDSRVNAGFVYGYTASNTGSCHSGWFSRFHTYNRVWRQVARYDYSE